MNPSEGGLLTKITIIKKLESKSVDTSGIAKNAEAINEVDKKATVNEKRNESLNAHVNGQVINANENANENANANGAQAAPLAIDRWRIFYCNSYVKTAGLPGSHLLHRLAAMPDQQVRYDVLSRRR